MNLNRNLAHRWFTILIFGALAALSLLQTGGKLSPVAADGPPLQYFPTARPDDGKMLGLAGDGLHTLGATRLNLGLAVAAGSSSFDIGIFDGDTGKNASGNLSPTGGHWDSGTDELVFSLYADPMEDQTGTVLLAQWTGNSPNALSDTFWTASNSSMPDNAWWNATVRTSPEARSPNGNYFYNLQITLTNPAGTASSDFKLRSTANLEVHASTFAFEGSLRQSTNDGKILYPQWDGSTIGLPNNFFLTTPTTYDGNWTYYLEVLTSLRDFTVWDGDFDYGTQAAVGSPSGVALEQTLDDDDPDTANSGVPPWGVGTSAEAEGAKGAGSPADELRYDFYRRTPAVRYRLIDPNGKAYVNNNPSGNNEWEHFRVSTDSQATRVEADYAPNVSADGGFTYADAGYLPAGIWRLNVWGLDLGNLDFLKSDQTILAVCEDGTPCPTRVPIHPLSIRSRVVLDVNGNGVLEDGELGIAGVLLDLLDENGQLVAQTRTDAGGAYDFQVHPGTYTVRLNAANFAPGGVLSGLTLTLGAVTQTVTLVSSNATDLNFGVTGYPGSIGDRVWRDINGNGVQDSGEPGLAGVGLTLLDSAGVPVQSTVTDGSGLYSFAGLAAGTYTVTTDVTTLPGGVAATYDLDGTATPNRSSVTLLPAQVRSDVDFGYALAPPAGIGSIGDRVWLDLNGNGLVDGGEPGLAGVKVILSWDTNRDGIAEFTSTVTTDATGTYRFSLLPSALYTVSIDPRTLPPGVAANYDLDGVGSPNTAALSLNAGQNRADVDFGYQGSAALGDRVWLDTNGNGYLDAGETGISGVRVSLAGLGLSLVTTTDASGSYGFARLPAGTYTVSVDPATLPAGSRQTYDLDGRGTPNSAVVSLASGQTRLDADFGYLLPNCHVTGLLWLDSYHDGLYQKGELLLSGVTVVLTDSFGAVVATTTTNASGAYTFDALYPGAYVVSAPNTANGYALFGASQTTLYVAAGDTAFHAFGYVGASVSGHVYIDTNRNGKLDSGESGANLSSKVTLVIRNAAGAIVGTTAANGSGSYRFDDLPAGTYQVEAPESAGSQRLRTARTLTATVTEGGSASDRDFGYYPINNKGAYTTYTQGGWGTTPHGNNPGSILAANFAEVCPAGVTIGGTFTLRFTSASAVAAFLPQGGTPSTLTASAVNPTARTSAGVFAGQLLSLQLNMLFSSAGITRSGLGSLYLTSGKLSGYTVDQVLALANRVLGGDTSALPRGVKVADLSDICTSINENYDSGTTDNGYLKANRVAGGRR